MGGNDNGLEFLDLLSIASFILQVQTQSHVVGLSDVQGEVNRAVDAINAHLREQDAKINRILEALYHGNGKETG